MANPELLDVIDLHCHLLPGIDDGARTLDDALAMVNYAINAGITKFVATPHITPGRYDNSVETIKPAFNLLKQAVNSNELAIEMAFAAEIRFDSVIIDMVNNDCLPYLGEYEGEQLILLEFPHSHIPAGYDQLIKWLAKKGIRVLIAHPERNRSVLGNIEMLKPLVELGCLFQITGGSLTGVFKDAARECAIELLKRDWVTIIASDAHNVRARCPELEPARQVAEEIIGEELANQMVFDRPDAISRVHFN
ncbi:MAG: CpsB/CapC family capsule biosynthesis tyrosine phosphatase [Pseudomonadota bacterium]